MTARHWAFLVVCAALSLTAAQSAQQGTSRQSKPVYVGFIEDDRSELAKKNDSAPGAHRIIVPAFEKDASGWKIVRELKEKVKWTVAFDGKKLGEVESQPGSAPEVIVQPNPVESSGYTHEVHTILTHSDKVPAIGRPARKFSGAFGGLVRRPLVVVSRPNFQDPDQWKRATLPMELVQPVHEGFRQSYPHVRQCDKEGEPLQRDWQVPYSELNIVGTYGSNKGSLLVQTQLQRHRCVFEVNGKDVTDLAGTQWFFVGPDHVARGLGDNCALGDAGAYEGDGRTEDIFFSGDSESGERM